jgi:galactokinase
VGRNGETGRLVDGTEAILQGIIQTIDYTDPLKVGLFYRHWRQMIMKREQRKKIVADEFVKRYGASPDYWTRAPGRVDLMGSHTDYNMGFVMTMTIDRDTWIAARIREDKQIRVSSLNFDGSAEFLLEMIAKDDNTPWSNYVRGMAKVFLDAGYRLQGFDGLIHSTVPLSSGLSSSAALEMALAQMFQQVGDFQIDPIDMALLGQRAENHFVGVNSGVLDQYSSAMGREGEAILLDCRALTSKPVNQSSNLQVVICNTNAPRNLVGSEYDDRRRQCEAGVDILSEHFERISALRDVSKNQFELVRAEMPEVVQKRCQFIIEENLRVIGLEEPLQVGDREQLNTLFRESYHGARDLYEIVVPAMTHMMEAMLGAPGVIAARQAGAGFGGCMIALIEPEKLNAFTQTVQVDYFSRSGIEAKIFPVKASKGASVIDWSV